MSSLFDRFNAELDQIGERVRTVFESSRLHLDRSALVGQRSKAAYKLGMLVYKKARGGELRFVLCRAPGEVVVPNGGVGWCLA